MGNSTTSHARDGKVESRHGMLNSGERHNIELKLNLSLSSRLPHLVPLSISAVYRFVSPIEVKEFYEKIRLNVQMGHMCSLDNT